MIRTSPCLIAFLLTTSAAAGQAASPRAYFSGDREVVSEMLAKQCVETKRDVERRDDREVVCSKPVGGLKGAWMKFGVGRSSYDNAARQRFKFVILHREGLIEVTAAQDIGPGQKPQAWTPDSAEAAMRLLIAAGGASVPTDVRPPSTPAVRTTGPLIVTPVP